MSHNTHHDVTIHVSWQCHVICVSWCHIIRIMMMSRNRRVLMMSQNTRVLMMSGNTHVLMMYTCHDDADDGGADFMLFASVLFLMTFLFNVRNNFLTEELALYVFPYPFITDSNRFQMFLTAVPPACCRRGHPTPSTMERLNLLENI